MFFTSKIRSFLLYVIKVLKIRILGHNRIESSKYKWEKITEGLFNEKELLLPKEWGYKVINCIHEVEIFDVIKKFAPKYNVMYDIGSHYGWFSIAWICAGGKYVEAFEPAKKNADIMMETILKNKFEKQIHLHRIALSDIDNEDNLYLFKGDSSRNFIKRSDQDKTSEMVCIERVKTYRLDYLKDKIKKPDLIKIDVEGHESEVLAGARNFIIETAPAIVVEVHDTTNALEVANFFCDLEYDMKILGYKGRNKSLPFVLWKKRSS